MKSIFFALLLTGAGALSAQAQSVKWIAEAGLSESTFNAAPVVVSGSETETNNYSARAGFHAGLTAEFSFSHFSLDPGIQYAQRGGDVHFVYNYNNGAGISTNLTGDQQTSINYIEVPVNVLYHFGTGKTVSFFVGAGPYAGYGLSGKSNGVTTFTQTMSGSTTTSQSSGDVDEQFGSNADKRFIYGANAIAGITFLKNLRFSVGYLYDISGPFSGASPKIHDNTLKLSLGYAF